MSHPPRRERAWRILRSSTRARSLSASSARAFLARPRQDEHELLSPVTRGQVAGAVGGSAHRAPDLGEAGVSGQVAVAVVEILEEVDVDEDERERGRVAGRTPPFVAQHLVEAAAVGEAGQGVEGGEALELGVRLRELPLHLRQLLVRALDLLRVAFEPLEVRIQGLEVVPRARGDGLHHGHEGARAGGDVFLELVLRDLEQARRLERIDGRGADLRLDEGHLPVVVAGAALGDLLSPLRTPIRPSRTTYMARPGSPS